METRTVALAAMLPPNVEGFLRTSGIPLELRHLTGRTEDYLVEALADVDAVLVSSREAVTPRVMAAMKRCKVMSRRGVGIDNLDVEAATRYGIAVACVPDASVEEVSDHAVALLLACARRIVWLNQTVKSGRWAEMGSPAPSPARQGMHRLTECVLGVVGFGRLGRATWRKAKAFGLKGLVYDPIVPQTAVRTEGAEPVGLEELLARSDFVTLHVPLTAQTKGLIDPEALAKMKPTAFLVNTSRGGVVDQEALAEAVAAGKLAGAALDVTDYEPLPADSRLMALDRILLTGHSAYLSLESEVELSRRAAENILAALRGEVPAGIVNPEVLQGSK